MDLQFGEAAGMSHLTIIIFK